MKPYFEEAGITIFHGDCREVLGMYSGFIVTDPPYGIDHPTDYRARGRGALAECADYPRVAGDAEPFEPSFLLDRPCVLFGANYFADRLPPSSGWLVWDKMRPHGLDQATAELAWSNFVKGVRVFRYLWNGMIRDGNEALEHPTQKPVALMKWILALKWTPAGRVIDPFMGAGSTLIAAKDMGREAVGIELEERYCEIAARRLSQSAMQFGTQNESRD